MFVAVLALMDLEHRLNPIAVIKHYYDLIETDPVFLCIVTLLHLTLINYRRTLYIILFISEIKISDNLL